MAEKFGERIRRLRTEQKLGLRSFAKTIGISPTYLSRIETNEEKSPPAEKVIRAIANELGDDFDELMGMAGRVASDVEKVITKDPGMPAFLRTAKEKNLSSGELMKMISKKKGGK